MKLLLILLYLSLCLFYSPYYSVALRTCIPRQFAAGPVCVCNATYCDEVPPVGELSLGEAAIYVTSKSGKRFERTTAHFQQQPASAASLPALPLIVIPTKRTIYVNASQQYQRIIGFGGAFTDSAGVNMNRLSEDARANLLGAYFGQEGIGYTLARVIMASCDFSPRVYSYDDLYRDPLQCPALSLLECLITALIGGTDFELKKFNLTAEDFSFKISFYKDKLLISNEKKSI